MLRGFKWSVSGPLTPAVAALSPTSAFELPAQPVDATLYLKGEMECA